MQVGHSYQSAKINSSDSSLVSSTAWNGPHAVTYTVQTKSSDYTIAAGDDVIRCSGTMNLAVPAASGSGRQVRVIMESGTVAITIVRSGSDTIGNTTGFVCTTAGDSFVLTDAGTGKWGLSYSSGHEVREGFTTTATAGGTTVLSATSMMDQVFTGSSNQTVQLPAGTSLPLGAPFRFQNASSGILTIVNADGTTVVGYVFPNLEMRLLLAANGASNGTWQVVGPQTAYNYSTAAQTPSATTRTYIAGSSIVAPVAGKFKIGSTFRWRIQLTKTAAGTASSTFDICFGTAGTTSDTARVSFTKKAGTGVADTGFVEIMCTIRGPLSASCVAVGTFALVHDLNSTGHATTANVVVNTVSSAFDITAATTVGVCITSGASDAITIQQVIAEGSGL